MRLPCRLLLFALSMMALPAAAQTAIHHCIDRSGNPVFTDQPCATMQASPVRASPAPEDASPAVPPMLCAASRDDLRQGVIAAFAQRDANRLAGLMLWNGYGRRAASADIQSLTSLVRQPLLGIDFPGDPPTVVGETLPFPPAPEPSSAVVSAPTQLVLEVAGQSAAGVPRQWRFDLVRRAGCVWLRQAD